MVDYEWGDLVKDLKNRLQKIDGRGYKSYKDIEGVYDFSFYTLYIDHVQGNPFAAPSRIRVSVFPEELWSGVRRVALEDYLTWRFQAAIFDAVRGRQGRGKGGLLRYLKSCSFGWQGASCYQDAVKIRAEDGRRVEKVYKSIYQQVTLWAGCKEAYFP